VASITANTNSETLNDLYRTGRSDLKTTAVDSVYNTPSVVKDIFGRAKKSEYPTGRRYEWAVELGSFSTVRRRAFDTGTAMVGENPNLSVFASCEISTYEFLMEVNWDARKLGMGAEGMWNQVEGRVKAAGAYLRDTLETDLLATSTATNGIQSIIEFLAATPTSGTLQGLSRSTYANWRNATTTTGGSFASVGLNQLRSTYLAASKGQGEGEPDLIITDDTVFDYFWRLNDSRDQIILEDKPTGKSIPRAMKFLNAKWVWSQRYPNSTTARMLNTSMLEPVIIGGTDETGITINDWVPCYNAPKDGSIVSWQGALKFLAARWMAQISGWTE
jgi:hypothetical protein